MEASAAPHARYESRVVDPGQGAFRSMCWRARDAAGFKAYEDKGCGQWGSE